MFHRSVQSGFYVYKEKGAVYSKCTKSCFLVLPRGLWNFSLQALLTCLQRTDSKASQQLLASSKHTFWSLRVVEAPPAVPFFSTCAPDLSPLQLSAHINYSYLLPKLFMAPILVTVIILFNWRLYILIKCKFEMKELFLRKPNSMLWKDSRIDVIESHVRKMTLKFWGK